MSNQADKNRKFDLLSDLDPLVHSQARLLVMTYLYVVEKMDYVYLQRVTDLSWGNLSKHLSKLEEAGYIETEKTFIDKKPNTTVWLTDEGRSAYASYKEKIQSVLGSLPD